MLADLLDLLPQGQKVGEGVRLAAGLAEKSGRVVGGHEEDAVLIVELAVLPDYRKVLPDHPLGRHPPQTDHDLRFEQTELLPQPGHTGFALGGQGVAVLRRAALDDVGDIAVLFAVQVDGEEVFVQQLAAAAHKRQALLILALAGAFAHEQHLGVLGTLTEHHVRPRFAQPTAAAGKALSLECFPFHISLNLSQTK